MPQGLTFAQQMAAAQITVREDMNAVPDLFSTKITNERFVHNYEELPADLLNFRHFITNALPYGPALERGSSAQAPQGFAGLTAVEWPNIVSFAVGKVGGGIYQGGAL